MYAERARCRYRPGEPAFKTNKPSALYNCSIASIVVRFTARNQRVITRRSSRGRARSENRFPVTPESGIIRFRNRSVYGSGRLDSRGPDPQTHGLTRVAVVLLRRYTRLYCIVYYSRPKIRIVAMS